MMPWRVILKYMNQNHKNLQLIEEKMALIVLAQYEKKNMMMLRRRRPTQVVLTVLILWILFFFDSGSGILSSAIIIDEQQDDGSNDLSSSSSSSSPLSSTTTKRRKKKKIEIETKEIAPGVHMPFLSIGTGGKQSKQTTQIVSNWLQIGGTGIDTSPKYKGAQDKIRDVMYGVVTSVTDDNNDDDTDNDNELLLVSPYQREDIFLTSKVRDCNATKTITGVKQILSKLGTRYIDLLLIHQPWNHNSDDDGKGCVDAWNILEKYYQMGVARAVGVSNFQIKDLEPLLTSEQTSIVPHVNQIRLNLYEFDVELIEYCDAHNIQIEAYSPLRPRISTKDMLVKHPTLVSIASKHHKSAYQVAIKWILQHDWILTFQSTSQKHQFMNADVFDFTLSDDEMSQLDLIGKGGGGIGSGETTKKNENSNEL